MERAVSPVVAVVLLIGITVVGVAGVATVATGLDERAEPSGADVTLSVSTDAETQAITLAHRGGRSFDLENSSVRIAVDGEPLAHQPPVPYFAAEGFQGTPTGPFNSGGESVFDPGEEGTIRIASTNSPHFEAGDRVTVTISRDDRAIARAEVVAG